MIKCQSAATFSTANFIQRKLLVTIVRMSTDECGIVGHYSIVINLAPLI